MVSSVRIRISPLLFCRSLQEKRRDLVEFRLWIGTPYTNDYTNALGQKYVQPIGDLSLNIRQHVRVEVEGRVYSGVTEHHLDHLGVFTTGEHEGGETVAQRVQGDVRQTRTLEQRLKGTPEDVVAVEGRADRRGEIEAGILPGGHRMQLAVPEEVNRLLLETSGVAKAR
jgi:hypothetical protein